MLGLLCVFGCGWWVLLARMIGWGVLWDALNRLCFGFRLRLCSVAFEFWLVICVVVLCSCLYLLVCAFEFGCYSL